jgi:hypothetical protein
MSGVALSVCVMPNITTPLTSAEVAQRVGDNIRTILAEQGHDLVWLAAEIGIDVQAILKQFTTELEWWLTLESAIILNVPVPRILGDARA